MQMMVNLNVAVERELELERSGQRRTRRWIGDTPRDADPGWNKVKVSQVPGPLYRQNGSIKIESSSRRSETQSSFVKRLFQFPIFRRQTVKSEA
jgi:hypothetical protein